MQLNNEKIGISRPRALLLFVNTMFHPVHSTGWSSTTQTILQYHNVKVSGAQFSLSA